MANFTAKPSIFDKYNITIYQESDILSNVYILNINNYKKVLLQIDGLNNEYTLNNTIFLDNEYTTEKINALSLLSIMFQDIKDEVNKILDEQNNSFKDVEFNGEWEWKY